MTADAAEKGTDETRVIFYGYSSQDLIALLCLCLCMPLRSGPVPMTGNTLPR